MTVSRAITERYGKSRKERTTGYFHGTSVDRLPSIMAQGLIPHVKKRAWHEDPDASLGQVSRASYGGTYLTRNLMTAHASARHASGPDYWKTPHKHKAIVMVQAHPKGLVADEDSVAPHLKNVVSPYSDHESHVVSTYMALHHGGETGKQHAEEVRHNYVNRVVADLTTKRPHLNHPRAIEQIKQVAHRGFEAALTRAVSHTPKSWGSSHKYEWGKHYAEAVPKTSDRRHDEWNKAYENPPPVPTTQHGERAFRDYADKMTKTVKSIVPRGGSPSSEHRWAHGRSLQSIGFHGKQKITGVVTMGKPSRKEFAQMKKLHVKSGSKSPGPRYSDVVRHVHGDISPEFVKEYHQHIGPHLYVSRGGKVTLHHQKDGSII